MKIKGQKWNMINTSGAKIRSKVSIIIKKRIKHKGQYFLPPIDKIEIRSNLRPRMYLNVICHELVHRAFPELSERKTLIAERIIADGLWQENYRKVNQ